METDTHTYREEVMRMEAETGDTAEAKERQ